MSNELDPTTDFLPDDCKKFLAESIGNEVELFSVSVSKGNNPGLKFIVKEKLSSTEIAGTTTKVGEMRNLVNERLNSLLLKADVNF